MLKYCFCAYRTLTADVIKCRSREREFDDENVLGKKVFLSCYSSFCTSLIPAVLGKAGKNVMKNLHPFLSWVWSVGEESWSVKPFSKLHHRRNVAGSNWTSSQLPHPYNPKHESNTETSSLLKLLHMDSFACVDFFTMYWRVGGQDFQVGNMG